jgi:PAS domain S-box-containing protein
MSSASQFITAVAVTALAALFAALAWVVAPLADVGTAWLPLLAAVVMTTALGGARWGLPVCALGAVLPLLTFVRPGTTLTTDPGLQSSLAVYLVTALLACAVVASLRARITAFAAGQALLEETLDQIADGVITTDRATRVVRLNRSAERLTGWREADARGKPIAQVLRFAERAPGVVGDAQHLPGAGAPATVMCTLVASDGSEHTVVPLGSTVPAPRGDGGRVILLRDATGWRQLEGELRALIADLWRANRAKDETIVALSTGRELPRPTAAPPDAAPNAWPVAQSDPDTQPSDEHTPPSAHRVLMLCEDSDSAFALSMLLGLAGYDVQTTSSAPDAIRHAARFAPHVALIDTEMARGDGHATARALRLACADLDLVALTPPGVTPDAHELAAAGYAVAVPKSEPLVLKRWLATRHAA